MARWIELIAGVLAAVIGLVIAGVGVALGGALAGALIGLGGLGAGIGAYQHALRANDTGLTVLWVSALLLVVMTLLAVFSLGLFLLPGTVSALVAAGVGFWRSRGGRAAAG